MRALLGTWPRGLGLKHAHLFTSEFIFSIILLTVISLTLFSLITSSPSIRALFFISNPKSTISWLIASVFPIGTNTLFLCCSRALIRFRIYLVLLLPFLGFVHTFLRWWWRRLPSLPSLGGKSLPLVAGYRDEQDPQQVSLWYLLSVNQIAV